MKVTTSNGDKAYVPNSKNRRYLLITRGSVNEVWRVLELDVICAIMTNTNEILKVHKIITQKFVLMP